MQRTSVIIGLLFVFAVTLKAQNPQFYRDKPGACPPAQPVQICTNSCDTDSDCIGIGKCCPTHCNGRVCTIPVTPKKPPTERPGLCPEKPTGRWVCSPTCSSDSDCRHPNKKCCKNRCGALACLKPDPEPVEPEVTFEQPASSDDSDNTNLADINPSNPFLFPGN